MTGPVIWDDKKKATSNRVTIDPITRLEGHGKIEIFLDDSGNVSNAYWQVPEVRGFERFCVGRKVVELNQITARLCGVCPGAHHLASTKAIDGCYNTKPTESAFRIRDLFYHAHFVHSHIAHFYALAGPDFVCGPAAPAAERNVLGVVARVGLELGSAVLKARAEAQKIQGIIGGKPTHPVMGVPGGVSKAISKEEAKEIQGYADNLVAFAETSLGVFKSVVLENKDYLDIIKNPDLYYSELYSMGLVNSKNQLEFHDGQVRVVDPNGKETDKYDPYDYLDHIGEAVEPWSYEKFPYLRNPGYKGLVDGVGSGMYRATPLGRLNVSDSISTPKAQAAFEEFRAIFKSLGVEGPVHFNLATHWARIIEMIYAAEKVHQNAYDPDITDPNIKQKDIVPGGRGVGCVEAPRGTLTHEYHSDENGIVTACNLVVGTTNNNGPMNIDTVKIAKALIKDHMISPGLLNMIEMAFRVYDPCNSCATHSLPGQMPIKAVIRNADGSVYDTVTKNL
ncbi:MAG: Ni/Fe hydrogenase subunit alpha [Methanomassiliicoccaceae archaeon]|nr:Ni/Fe hydrogenase subunit alpha [Methanomassiliicoccaceae archaeon]MCL2145764.1 Ni/Fe hydrogenase subunit alpha [Methanomassiliicoccaceae archaeon]